MTIQIVELYIYPVKSCGGVRVGRTRVGPRGFELDREWVIVDADSRQFLTQREIPRMALIGCSVEDDRLTLTIPGGKSIAIPDVASDSPELTATVWMHACRARDCGNEIADALTAYLQPPKGKRCRLVRLSPKDERKSIDGKARISAVDAYPCHGASEASLADLNRRLDAPLPMNRFRPNLIFSGCEAYAEDTWKTFRAGDVEFAATFPCIRCTVTTVDQATAETGKEPLATLATYRKAGMKVIFGQYYYHLNEGAIEVGAEITPREITG